MVPLWSLPVAAFIVAAAAAGVASLRRLEKSRVAADLWAALAAGAVCIVAGFLLYILSDHRNAAALCFLIFPLAAVGALRLAGRNGAMLGAFLGAALAVGLSGVWIILYLKGPRGGWMPFEVLTCATSFLAGYVAAACFGWWCGRATKRSHA